MSIEIRAAALSVVTLLTLTAQCWAFDLKGPTVRDNLVVPRDIFFSDYFLSSAQADVISMTAIERIAFASLLDTCANALSADEASRLRCEMTRQRYLMDYRRDRLVDRLLDAMQFFTSLIRYNKAIDRVNEVGIEGRLEGLYSGLRDALHSANRMIAAKPINKISN